MKKKMRRMKTIIISTNKFNINSLNSVANIKKNASLSLQCAA